MKKSNLVLSAMGLVITLGISLQAHAGKPVSVVCGNGKTIAMDSSKNSPASQARLCSKAGHPAPLKKPTTPGNAGAGALSSKGAAGEKQGLLLPAVQAAREAARQPTLPKANKKNLSARPSKPAADTTCNGVNACNDMMATCIAMGGNVTPTSYDPGTGSPNGATCFN